MTDALTLILGGGRGTRLHPLTKHRSKPAVPIAGKYRLIDVPISNCLHAGLQRIFVLTQFNSASLNRHIAQTYRMDHFSNGFVEILAAEQTPESSNWFQGTADAVRQAARHFADYDADYFLILAGDHLYRMDLDELVAAHIETRADITIAAQPVTIDDASSMGVFVFDRDGQVAEFLEKPDRVQLARLGPSLPETAYIGGRVADKPLVASMGIYVFSRDVLLDLIGQQPGVDFGREIIPAALKLYRVLAFLHRGYWADVGTVPSFYDANLLMTRRGAPFDFSHPRRPIYTRPRFLAASRIHASTIDDALISEGCHLDECTVRESVVGLRTIVRQAARITRSVLLGADCYDEGDGPANAHEIPLGIGREAVLDRVIVDKNARIGDGVRLVNERAVTDEDGNGYCIRNGIIVVEKGAVIPPGTVV
jgi:glucose-1-phosphate adenylyltransferase